MANLPTPALRKKRILRDVCLLGLPLLHPESGPLGASKGKLF